MAEFHHTAEIKNKMCHSIYLKNGLAPTLRKNTIKALKEKIIYSNVIFDTVAFTGMSGALIAPTVADRLNKKLLMVRKKDDSCAITGWNTFLEGNVNYNKYIIIDDLISSGRTVRKIFNYLGHEKCAGIFLYGDEIEKRGNIYLAQWADELNCPVYSIFNY